MPVYKVIFTYPGWGTQILHIAISNIQEVFEIVEDLMRETLTSGEAPEKFLVKNMEYQSITKVLELDNLD